MQAGRRHVARRRPRQSGPDARLSALDRLAAGTRTGLDHKHLPDSGSVARVDNREKYRMGAVVSGLPTMGYALEVDGRLKTEFETKEGA